AAFKPGRLVVSCRPPELEDKTRFARAGLTGEKSDLTAARPRLVESFAQELEFAGAPDEGREPARRGRREAAPHRLLADRLVDDDGLGTPDDRVGADKPAIDVVPDKAVGAIREPNHVGQSEQGQE